MSYNIIHDSNQNADPWNNVSFNNVRANIVDIDSLNVDNITAQNISSNTITVTTNLTTPDLDAINISSVDIQCTDIDATNVNGDIINADEVKSQVYRFFPYDPETSLSSYVNYSISNILLSNFDPSSNIANATYTRIGIFNSLNITPILTAPIVVTFNYLQPSAVSYLDIGLLELGPQISGLVYNSLTLGIRVAALSTYINGPDLFRFYITLVKGATINASYIQLSQPSAAFWLAADKITGISISYNS
jgi:hypothetical protein